MKAPRVSRKKGKHDPLLVWYQNKPCLIHGIHFHNFDTLKRGSFFDTKNGQKKDRKVVVYSLQANLIKAA